MALRAQVQEEPDGPGLSVDCARSVSERRTNRMPQHQARKNWLSSHDGRASIAIKIVATNARPELPASFTPLKHTPRSGRPIGFSCSSISGRRDNAIHDRAQAGPIATVVELRATIGARSLSIVAFVLSGVFGEALHGCDETLPLSLILVYWVNAGKRSLRCCSRTLCCNAAVA